MREMLIGLEPATVLTMKGMRFVRHRPMRAAILLICCSLAACHRNDAENDVKAASAVVPPTVLQHELVFQRQQGGRPQLALQAMPPGSRDGLVIIGVGRGIASATQSPFDTTSGILATAVGEPHRYTKYPDSGTAVYMLASRHDDAPRRIAVNLPPQDEVTLAALQVERSRLQDAVWNEAYPGKILHRQRVRSGKVRTTGPATLIAFWWGDAGVRGRKTAVPGQGFQLLDAVLEEGALVQCAVAVKEVSAAGEYEVTWTATPRQAAQLWLMALQ